MTFSRQTVMFFSHRRICRQPPAGTRNLRQPAGAADLFFFNQIAGSRLGHFYRPVYHCRRGYRRPGGKDVNRRDPGCIVIDEMAGKWWHCSDYRLIFPLSWAAFWFFAAWILSSLFPFAGWKGAYPADSVSLRTISWPG